EDLRRWLFTTGNDPGNWCKLCPLARQRYGEEPLYHNRYGAKTTNRIYVGPSLEAVEVHGPYPPP
ncbi:hypothetical protein HOY80DRAFT_1094963, partial [Tuber brumale]